MEKPDLRVGGRVVLGEDDKDVEWGPSQTALTGPNCIDNDNDTVIGTAGGLILQLVGDQEGVAVPRAALGKAAPGKAADCEQCKCEGESSRCLPDACQMYRSSSWGLAVTSGKAFSSTSR